MRRPVLRIRELLVVVLLVALALAWEGRRRRLLGLAESHRASQKFASSLQDGRRWWNIDRERNLHAQWGIDHPGNGRTCLVCLGESERAHERAADAYEAAAWLPWKSPPGNPISLSDPLLILPDSFFGPLGKVPED